MMRRYSDEERMGLCEDCEGCEGCGERLVFNYIEACSSFRPKKRPKSGSIEG